MGGGALIAVKKNYSSHEVLLKHDSIEMVCAKIIFEHSSIFVFCVYLPPDATLDNYYDCIENIETILDFAAPCDEFILIGDFNLPDISWNTSEDDEFYSLVPTDFSSEKSTGFLVTTFPSQPHKKLYGKNARPCLHWRS